MAPISQLAAAGDRKSACGPRSAAFGLQSLVCGLWSKVSSAYTLIEILVSIAILSLMVVAIARIVTDITRATKAGHRQAYDDANARAVMDMILDDLTQAVNEQSINMFRLTKNDTTYSGSLQAHDLQFVAALGPNFPASNNDEKETLRIVRYYLNTKPAVGNTTDPDYPMGETYQLYRSEEPPANNNASSVLELLVEFRVTLYDDQRNEIPGGNIDYLPAFVNIYFSVLSEEDHLRARRIQMQAGDAAMTAYIQKNAHRYFTQAFIPVRNGRKTEYNY